MLIHDKHLFPLSLLSQNIGNAYFLSVDGKVYSNRTGSLVELRGSRSANGVYYKFGRSHGSGWRHDLIVTLARVHENWKLETGQAVDEAAEPVKAHASEAGIASTTEAGIAAKGIIIGRLLNGHLVFSHDAKVHLTEDSAQSEMERLALKHPGTKFVAFKTMQTAIAGGVSWE